MKLNAVSPISLVNNPSSVEKFFTAPGDGSEPLDRQGETSKRRGPSQVRAVSRSSNRNDD